MIVTVVFIALVGAGVFIGLRLYPVAFVNGVPITARSYYAGYRIAYNYANHFNNYSRNAVLDSTVKKTIQKAALEGMIDHILIVNRLRQEMRPTELNRKVNEQVSRLTQDPIFLKELLSILGVSERVARNIYLNQQALYSILEGRLALEQITLFDWLTKEREKARVTVLLPSLYWDGDQAQLKTD